MTDRSPSQWPTVPLKDVTTKIGSGATPRGGKEVYRDAGTAFIRSQNVYDNRFSFDGLARISDEAAEALRGVEVLPGDVLINITGESVTRTAMVPDSTLPARVSQHVAIVRPDQTVLDSRFLLSALLNPPTKSHLNILSEAGATRRALTKSHIERTTISLPPLDEQRRIAGVLGTFNDLIESNRIQAARLDQLISAAGRSITGTIKSRPRQPLPEFVTVTKGFSYRSGELIEGADTLVNLKNIGRGGIFQRDGFKPLTSDRFKPAQVVRPGDVVVSMTDLTQNRDVIARPVRIPDVAVSGQMVASLDLAVVRPKPGLDPEVLAAVLAQEEFHEFALGYCNGTTVLHMSGRVFDAYEFPIFSAEESAAIATKLRPLYSERDALMNEITEVERTRDELLPLLISGRVHVSEDLAVA